MDKCYALDFHDISTGDKFISLVILQHTDRQQKLSELSRS